MCQLMEKILCWCSVFISSGSQRNVLAKGKSKSVHILDTVETFLDNPYSSERSPLEVKPPLGPATPTIASYSVVHSIGFSKSLACKLIVLAVEEMMRKGSMSTEELSSVQSFLKPLFYVKAVWKGSSGLADDVYQSIVGKMMESQRPRPEVVRVCYAVQDGGCTVRGLHQRLVAGVHRMGHQHKADLRFGV